MSWNTTNKPRHSDKRRGVSPPCGATPRRADASTLAIASLALLAGSVVAAPPAPAPHAVTPAAIPAPRIATSAVPINLVDTQEVIIFGSTRPVRARLAITYEGKPLAGIWRDKLKRTFDHFDRDKDGYLAEAEVGNSFSDSGMLILLQNGFYQPTPQDRPSVARLDTDGNKRVTFDEFVAYYKQSTAQIMRPQVPVAENPYNVSVTEGIFKMLDINGDGKLTKDEVLAAEKWLSTRDADEDECLSQAELTSNLYNPRDPRLVELELQQLELSGRRGTPAGPQIVHTFEAGRVPGTITQQLIKKYDKDNDFELTREESGFDELTFTRLDRDGNKKLDGEELDEWRTGVPDLDISLSMAPKAVDCVARVLGDAKDVAARGFEVKQVENGRVMIRTGRQPIEFWAFASVVGNQQVLKQQYLYLFQQPAGQKGYVEDKDLTGNNAVQFQFLRTIFGAADADGNGKLTKAEFDAYFDLQDSFRNVALSVTPAVQTPTLFQLLDENRDSRLSVRELRTAWTRLLALEPGNADVVTRAAIQPSVSLRLSRNLERYYVNQVQDIRGVNPNQQVLIPQKGPVWFRKMDRNADGDVSRIEYLGTRAEFDAIDTDHDALISLEEAEAWDKRMRLKETKK